MNNKFAIDVAMKRRMKKTAGQKANEGSHDDLDDLVLDDTLGDGRADLTAKNSGDELGHSKEVKNEDRVSRIMKRRSGK